jgi:hypothetical protein
MGKFFTTTVKPDITASEQHTAAFAADDLLFDWAAFDVPKGASRLVGITALIRGTSGADQTARAFDLLFAKAKPAKYQNTTTYFAPDTLGTENVAIAAGNKFRWKNEIIGIQNIATGDWNDTALISMNVATPETISQIVFESNTLSGTNVGYDKFYVAGIAQGALDFRSALTDNGGHATSVNQITVADSGALVNFAPGDVIHDEDDNLLGTIKLTNSDTIITFEANLANASTDDKVLYNLNPITLILSFEQ